jgi:REP element-mobilizing transposase RayT
MPHSYTALRVHVVFSTKDRKNLIDDLLEERLFPYIGGICRELGGSLTAINGAADHLHLLATVDSMTAVAEFVGKVKGCSSKWIHETFPERSRFAWQRGYAAFSVSESQTSRVAAYIGRQKTHHRTVSFRDEYVKLLESHGIPIDERYLWT